MVSIFETTYDPTFRSIITKLLEKNLLFSANSFEQAIKSFVSIIGIAVSGILLNVVGINACFVLCAIPYAISAVNIICIRKIQEIAISDSGLQKFHISTLVEGINNIMKAKILYYSFFLILILTWIVGYESPMFLPLVVEKGWGGASLVGYMLTVVSIG